jgi:hypothetical protein
MTFIVEAGLVFYQELLNRLDGRVRRHVYEGTLFSVGYCAIEQDLGALNVCASQGRSLVGMFGVCCLNDGLGPKWCAGVDRRRFGTPPAK